ncbi:hypothetical protein, partial [Mycolicibacterium peregrinum]|uniref:hypothetical protein n=1 Tax=Mycolicibacterium peregrinum TaxID=43304 RepID=UPI001041DF08
DQPAAIPSAPRRRASVLRRAISPTAPVPAPRQRDQDPSTQKFNPHDDEPPRRGGGMSAQDLLRREGRL